MGYVCDGGPRLASPERHCGPSRLQAELARLELRTSGLDGRMTLTTRAPVSRLSILGLRKHVAAPELQCASSSLTPSSFFDVPTNYSYHGVIAAYGIAQVR